MQIKSINNQSFNGFRKCDFEKLNKIALNQTEFLKRHQTVFGDVVDKETDAINWSLNPENFKDFDIYFHHTNDNVLISPLHIINNKTGAHSKVYCFDNPLDPLKFQNFKEIILNSLKITK